MRYWSTPPHVEIAQTQAWLDSMIAASPETSDDFIIEHQGRAVGKAGCWRLPEIGFILHPALHGQGLASEALHAVIGHVFATRTLDAIAADADPRNTPCLNLLGRLGFVETGRAARTWLVGTQWCDSVYLALSRETAEKLVPAQPKPLTRPGQTAT